MDRVKEVLGRPSHEEYVIISTGFGAGDLMYINDGVILVIECKRVIRRIGQAAKVRKQAIKYATVFHTLRPECCVYAITYTEYGFKVVEIFGELRVCSKFEEFLDYVAVEFS
jgi:hypothetical protein